MDNIFENFITSLVINCRACQKCLFVVNSGYVVVCNGDE